MKNNHIMMVANDTTFIYKLRKEILEAFIDKGYKVTVVAKKLKFISELESIGCRLLDFNLNRIGTNPISDINLLSQIKNILKREKPDLVFTNSIKPNVYFGICCKLYKIPFVPNITGLGRALEYPGLLQKISIFLYRIGMIGANIILFQNSFNRDFFIKHKIISEKKNYIILPGSGVNTKEYEILDYPDNEKINFLFIGRIRKEKGIDFVIHAAKNLNQNDKNVIFNICGLCEDDKYLEIFEKLRPFGYLIYHGEQKDLTNFYKNADCVVHPTYYPEGMSNVLLEACSHGRPIITTDRPGCKEIVEDGYNGYEIQTKSQNQLDKAIDKFINLNKNKREIMGLNGRKKIEEKFDRDIVVEKYIMLTNRIMGE